MCHCAFCLLLFLLLHLRLTLTLLVLLSVWFIWTMVNSPLLFFVSDRVLICYKKKVLIEKGFVDDVVLGDLERRIDNCDNCNVVMVLLLLSLNLNYHFTIST